MRGEATFDQTGIYRYRLLRVWEETLPRICWVMLNPSMACASTDDPTISRVIAFSLRWGYGSASVVNLFAVRTPHPRDLRLAADPVGPDNDREIRAAVLESDEVIAAWGNHGTIANPETGIPRCQEVLRLLDQTETRARNLGITKLGQPRHPLYLAASTTPISV